jgi:hypothetical protein
MSFRSRSLVLFIRTFSMGAEQKKKKRMRNRAHQIVQYFLRQILRHAYGVTSVNHADAKMGNIQKKRHGQNDVNMQK